MKSVYKNIRRLKPDMIVASEKLNLVVAGFVIRNSIYYERRVANLHSVLRKQMTEILNEM